SQMSVGRPYYESLGPGFNYYYPDPSLASRYGFYPGMYTGVARPSRFATSEGYWATIPSGYSPIFMTSLNYPGIYGSYAFGLTATAYNVAPAFQTRPDNLPSDNPVAAP